MTIQEREEIFSKEILTVDDITKLFECGLTTAYKIIREIKAKFDRLKISGIIHVQDYIDYYKLPQARYVLNKKEKTAHIPNATVC